MGNTLVEKVTDTDIRITKSLDPEISSISLTEAQRNIDLITKRKDNLQAQFALGIAQFDSDLAYWQDIVTQAKALGVK